MGIALSWPNLVTVFRAGLIVVVVLLAYGRDWWSLAMAAVVALLIIVGDWLDGHLARRLNQSSALGSVLDIAADRMAEAVLWIVLADLGTIPVWIPIVVISRGILTDTIRGYALRFGYSGFGQKSMQQTRLGKFITGSPVMRSGYAVLKAFSFTWLFLCLAARELASHVNFIPPNLLGPAFEIGKGAAILAAAICLFRGVPVVIEGLELIAREEERAE
jgi:CDP-diacylglycerol--glycerol-3-phosphate 3-phosphatidyltransferase